MKPPNGFSPPVSSRWPDGIQTLVPPSARLQEALVKRKQLAVELNAIWPSYPTHRVTLSEWHANCWYEVGGHSPSIKLREGWVRCADCGTTLYKAAEPDVARMILAMESIGGAS